MPDPLSVILFGGQHVKYASQGQSQRARPWLVFVCFFAEIYHDYLLSKREAKEN